MKRIFNLLITFLFVSISIFAQDAEMDAEAAKAYNEGNSKLKAGDYSGAISNYDLALKSSNDYRIYYQKGVSLKKLRKFDEAETAFKEAIKSNPNFDLAYNGLGGLYFSKGSYQEAIDNFVKFEQLTEKNSLKAKANEYISKCYTKLGSSAKSDGKYPQAVDYLAKAVEHFDYDAAYLMMAETYIEMGQFEKALSAANNALEHRKSISVGGPYYYQGKAYKGLNDLANAKESFNKGLKDSKYKSLCDYELKLMN